MTKKYEYESPPQNYNNVGVTTNTSVLCEKLILTGPNLAFVYPGGNSHGHQAGEDASPKKTPEEGSFLHNGGPNKTESRRIRPNRANLTPPKPWNENKNPKGSFPVIFTNIEAWWSTPMSVRRMMTVGGSLTVALPHQPSLGI